VASRSRRTRRSTTRHVATNRWQMLAEASTAVIKVLASVVALISAIKGCGPAA
jgi:hypothetical protein